MSWKSRGQNSKNEDHIMLGCPMIILEKEKLVWNVGKNKKEGPDRPTTLHRH
jgi:hypothetical protein